LDYLSIVDSQSVVQSCRKSVVDTVVGYRPMVVPLSPGVENSKLAPSMNLTMFVVAVVVFEVQNHPERSYTLRHTVYYQMVHFLRWSTSNHRSWLLTVMMVAKPTMVVVGCKRIELVLSLVVMVLADTSWMAAEVDTTVGSGLVCTDSVDYQDNYSDYPSLDMIQFVAHRLVRSVADTVVGCKPMVVLVSPVIELVAKRKPLD